MKKFLKILLSLVLTSAQVILTEASDRKPLKKNLKNTKWASKQTEKLKRLQHISSVDQLIEDAKNYLESNTNPSPNIIEAAFSFLENNDRPRDVLCLFENFVDKNQLLEEASEAAVLCLRKHIEPGKL